MCGLLLLFCTEYSLPIPLVARHSHAYRVESYLIPQIIPMISLELFTEQGIIWTRDSDIALKSSRWPNSSSICSAVSYLVEENPWIYIEVTTWQVVLLQNQDLKRYFRKEWCTDTGCEGGTLSRGFSRGFWGVGRQAWAQRNGQFLNP